MPAFLIPILDVLLGIGLALGFIGLIFGSDKGRKAFSQALSNLIGGAIDIAVPVLNGVAPALTPVLQGYADAFKNFGPAMRDTVAGPIGDLAQTNFSQATANLTRAGESTPDNAFDQAGAAFKQAYGFGMSSAAVTAAFEALFPEKLNVLNGAGPAFFEMAGFKEVATQVLDPLYENAFGKSLEYQFKALFKPELADEADAVQWHSRRLMTEADLREVFKYSGLKAKYEDAYVASAYRSVQPRAIASMIQDTPFPTAAMQSLLEFGGFRDQDIALLLKTMEYNSTKNVRQEYLSALVRSVELGTDTVANLVDAMNTMNFSQEAQTFVQLTVAERKINQLAELYRKSVSESYKYGTITDAQYVPALEAIGIDAADAQAHYAIDSIAKSGKIAAALLKAEERLAAAHTRAAMQAAIAQYRAGQINAAALEAALLAAGVDPTIAGFATVVQTARLAGAKILIYGIELARPEALLLREKVAALKEQALKKLSQPPAWLATLAALGIPDANAQALVSEWQAQANKAVLPI